MNKWPFILCGILLVACADDKENECTSKNVGTLTLDRNYFYTGEEIIIKGSGLCPNAVTEVLFGTTPATVAFVHTDKIVLDVPKTDDDSVFVKVVLPDRTITLEEKVAVFPGNGKWVAKQSFPGAGRWSSKFFDIGGKGYVLGGQRYLGYIDGKYTHEFYYDIFEYNPETDNWKTMSSVLENKYIEFFDVKLNNRFVFRYQGDEAMTAYDPVNDNFSAANVPVIAYEPNSFVLNGQTYVVRNIANLILSIEKYNPNSNAWEGVFNYGYGRNPEDPEYFFFPSTFIYDGKAYFTSMYLDDGKHDVWEFDPETNQAKIVSFFTTEVVGTGFAYLNHMFTIGKLAYFKEAGQSALAPSGATLTKPSPKLYIYNLEAKTWYTPAHEFPQPFQSPISFSINGRGFMGLGVNEASGSLIFLQNFYEFIPE